ncbi:2682_t:CDS:2 [Ambispora leptoticha]|uniref:2682_t:CDS:1 n=1 Tax=Ambispora leptoticha TaxID=144679 RepID=A0A9N9FU58_9GLOM|nr:2682_t:CDS:2 [Ambispora leptoticha]
MSTASTLYFIMYLSNNEKKVNCSKCHEKLNIYYQLCSICDLPPWSSKNKKIDEIIKEAQLEIIKKAQFEIWLEWVEYEEFGEIELIAEGGFGSVSKAIWNSGYVISFNRNQRKLVRAGPSPVALKMLFNSSNANCNTIQEKSEIHEGAVYKSRSISKIIEATGLTSMQITRLPDDIYVTRQFELSL